MSAPQPARSVASWPVPGTALTIECSLAVMEQLRAAAFGGLRQLSRGGLEVGGILLGEHDAGGIRILGWRPVPCEHARGPAFLLTDKDRAELANQLLTLTGESSGTGSHPLGWWISHTRGSADLTADDLEIYRQFFPASWQVTLVVHPVRDSTAEAGFFIRDVKGQAGPVTQKPFTISPARFSGRQSAVESPGARPSIGPSSIGPSNESPRGKLTHWRRAAARRALFDRRIWIWLVPALLALVVLSMIVDRKGASRPASFGFRASDVGGALRLEWDRNAETVRDATRATLDIKDGQATVPIALDADRLRQGFLTYARKSRDLEMRMTVFPATGSPVQEFTEYLGAPISHGVSPAEVADLQRDRDTLKNEVRQLREALRKETARSAQLRETARILQQRVGVPKAGPPKSR